MKLIPKIENGIAWIEDEDGKCLGYMERDEVADAAFKFQFATQELDYLASEALHEGAPTRFTKHEGDAP